jgi:hypothetical protein
MWSLYWTDLNSPPQDNPPLKLVGQWSNLAITAEELTTHKRSNPQAVRYVVVFEERKRT